MMNLAPAEAKASSAWVAAPRLTEPGLTGSFWSFGLLGVAPHTPFLVLAPDGLIGNYHHANEDLWQIIDGRLAFLSHHGVPTTIFDVAQLRDGAIVALAGRVLLGSVPLYHEVRRQGHPAHPLHASPPEAPRRARFLQAIARPLRPNLVVLRAGPGSLHPRWPQDLRDGGRTWDLCISAYGATEPAADEPAEYRTHQPDQRKFQALHDLFFEGSPLWDYERVWFPDDDLMVDHSAINRTFHIARKFGLDLAQPCLLPVAGCHITHRITMRHPGSILRYTGFVEIMCPVFSMRALRLCLGSFRDSVSGFGLDHLWPALLGGARSRIAIIDAAGVIHTRPLGRNYDVVAAVAEERALLAAYHLRAVAVPQLIVAAMPETASAPS
jgi:hypothetical protein